MDAATERTAVVQSVTVSITGPATVAWSAAGAPGFGGVRTVSLNGPVPAKSLTPMTGSRCVLSVAFVVVATSSRNTTDVLSNPEP